MHMSLAGLSFFSPHQNCFGFVAKLLHPLYCSIAPTFSKTADDSSIDVATSKSLIDFTGLSPSGGLKPLLPITAGVTAMPVFNDRRRQALTAG
jgi:hypothetical protein